MTGVILVFGVAIILVTAITFVQVCQIDDLKHRLDALGVEGEEKDDQTE